MNEIKKRKAKSRCRKKPSGSMTYIVKVHLKSGKYLRKDLSFTIKEDLSNITLLEVDGENVNEYDFISEYETENEILEVTDNEKSEHTENSNENSEGTEHTPQG